MRNYLFWTFTAIVTLAGLVALLLVWHHQALYKLSPAQSALLAKPSIDKSRLQETKTDIIYNSTAKSPTAQQVVVDAQADATGKFPYSVKFAKDPSKGITVTDAEKDIGFTMIPLQNLSDGKLIGERVVYPSGSNQQQIYTLKRNGIKEDIILKKTPASKTTSYSWELKTGDQLEARLNSDGSVGIYSASPYLFGNVTTSDEKDQKLMETARKHGKKDNMAFVIPRPYLIDERGVKNYDDVSFSLKDNVLSLEVRNLKNQQYPLSIDPSVIITSTADFQTGNDTGMIDYGTSGQINRNIITATGETGSFTTNANYFTTPRTGQTTVAYNGFIYVIGGFDGTSYKSDVQYAAINSGGDIGTFSSTTSFNIARSGHTSVAYNGYLYVTGGFDGGYKFDTLYAPINSNGTIGTWASSTSALANARNGASLVAYNGYLYLTGGYDGTSYYNDAQYAAVRADGSISTWTISGNTFTTARSGHSSVTYNGFLYVIGGSNGSALNTVYYAPLNSDGTVGAFTVTNAFTTARYGHTSVAYNGFLYLIGGYDGATYYNTIQYTSIKSDGSLNTWTANSSSNTLITARYGHSAAVYNGYLYTLGGQQAASDTNCKNSGTSQYCNDVLYTQLYGGAATGNAATNSNTAFGTARYGHSAVVYDGDLYVMGGITSAGTVLTTTQYAPISTAGVIGAWTVDATTLSGGRAFQTSFAYNGFIYMVGGQRSSSAGCKSNVGGTVIIDTTTTSIYCNEVLRSVVSAADGGIGTWTAVSNFNYARHSHSSVFYNGFLYVSGGIKADSSTGCKSSGTSTVCNDTQYAAVAADGSVGTFTTQSTAGFFTTPRYRHAAAAYNGYLYILGGEQASSTTSCKNSGTSIYCNDVQYAVINANGSLGNFSSNSTYYFSNPRHRLAAVAANNALYILGGFDGSTYYSDIQFSQIAKNGTLGGFSSPATFSTGRFGMAALAITTNSTRLYIIGGEASGPTDQTDVQSTVIPDVANSNAAFATNANYFATARGFQSTVAYNGYMYIMGGWDGTTFRSDVQYAAINADGSLGTWNSTTSFTTGRAAFASFAYNGYMYIMGGCKSGTYTGSTGCSASFASDIQSAPICDGISSFNGCSAGAANAGKLGTWATSATTLPVTEYGLAATAYNGIVYVVNSSSGIPGTISYAFVGNGDVGAFTTSANTMLGSLSIRDKFAVSSYNGYLYVVGGRSTSSTNCKFNASVASSECSEVQMAQIQSGGDISNFAVVGHVPTATDGRLHPGMVASNGYLYVDGGYISRTTTYLSDVEYAKINANGTLEPFSTGSSFTTARMGHGSVAYAGKLYVIGGEIASSTTSCKSSGTSQYCTDTQYSSLPKPAAKAVYEKVIDTGAVNNFSSLQVASSNNVCLMMTISYRAAGSDQIYGSASTVVINSNGTLGSDQVLQTISLSSLTAKRYLWVAVTFDDSTCGLQSNLTNLTLTYANGAPNAPTLSLPATSTTGVSLSSEFRMSATDDAGDYEQYKIEICTTSNCSSILTTITQASSQTGWLSQNTQSATAYTSGSTAIYRYTSALNANTQYWWRAYAIDPGGSNSYSSASSISTFTTVSAGNNSNVNIKGGTNLNGGTTLR